MATSDEGSWDVCTPVPIPLLQNNDEGKRYGSLDVCTGDPQGAGTAQELDVFEDDLDGFDWGEFDMRCQTIHESENIVPADQVSPPPPPSLLLPKRR